MQHAEWLQALARRAEERGRGVVVTLLPPGRPYRPTCPACKQQMGGEIVGEGMYRYKCRNPRCTLFGQLLEEYIHTVGAEG